MQDHDGALLEGQSAEGTLQLVPVGHLASGVGRRRVEAQSAKVRLERPLPTALVVAGADDQTVQPRVEERWIPQRGKVAPCREERRLDRVLGEVVILEDAAGDREQVIDRSGRERSESLSVSPAGLPHQILHASALRRERLLSQSLMAQQVRETFKKC
jgi:hypothetical protein